MEKWQKVMLRIKSVLDNRRNSVNMQVKVRDSLKYCIANAHIFIASVT